MFTWVPSVLPAITFLILAATIMQVGSCRPGHAADGDALIEEARIAELVADALERLALVSFDERAGPAAAASRCLAAVASARMVSDDGLRSKALSTVHKAAEVLVALVKRATDGAPGGWGYDLTSSKNCAGPGTLNPFQDGTCNDADTV